MEVGTMKELALQPGDVVRCVDDAGIGWWSEGDDYEVTPDGCLIDDDGAEFPVGSGCQPSIKFRIIRRANSQPKTWGEMTYAEQADVSVAAMNGDSVELDGGTFGWVAWDGVTPLSKVHQRIRIKPQPKRETEEIGWCQSDGPTDGILCHDTHRITFDTIDGKPVCDSIRMEEIK